ncbi:MAG: thioredoxin [Lachnospiraceae bacterium]|nr:thioredoxin [Lachnospiraceae bacterium]
MVCNKGAHTKECFQLYKGGAELEIVKVDENNFNEKVLQAKAPILVDFYADWCSHCRTISPVLDELSSEGQVRVAKVDVDQSPGLAQKYKIMAIPALLLFENGEVADKRTGGVSKQEILGMVK